MGPWLRSLAVWVVIILAESIHGTLRQLLLVPVMGDLPARRVSVFAGALIIFGVTWVFIRWMRPASGRQRLQIGALWVVLTVVFEIVLGRALGYSWDRLLEDYDLSRGGLMGLGLIAMLFTPWVAARVRGVPTR